MELLEDVGMGTLELLKEFAQVPRVAAIAGKANAYLMKEFKGTDIQDIEKVIVDMGNPLTRTTAGKIQLADSLAERNLIKDPDQYIQVMETGRLEPVIEGPQAELMNIRKENELMSIGQPVKAVITDNHPQHIDEHKTVIANPEARKNPAVVNKTLSHIMDHLTLWQGMPPDLAAALKITPASQHPMQGAGEPSPAGPMNPQIPGQAPAVQPPSNPKNPITKEPMPIPQGITAQIPVKG